MSPSTVSIELPNQYTENAQVSLVIRASGVFEPFTRVLPPAYGDPATWGEILAEDEEDDFIPLD